MTTDVSPSSFGAYPASETFLPCHTIAPPSRRFLAYLLDSVILYLVGRGIGTAFFNTLTQLGPWGRLIGFCIAISYFAILDSGIGSGQTVGKRLMHLRVVDALGNTISFRRAAVRFTVFAIPSYLNELQLPRAIDPLIGSIVLGVIVFGVGGSTLYLMIFNRNSRQGLHDLAAASYVVDSRPTGPVRTEPIWDMHWRILRWSLMLLILFSYSIWSVSSKWQKSGHISQRLEDTRLIEQLTLVQYARIENWRPPKGFNAFTKDPLLANNALVISVSWVGEAKDREAFADQVAGLILQNDPKAQEHDQISIRVGRSYHLGIASGGQAQTFTHTPAEWRQRSLAASKARTSLSAPKP